MKAFKKVVKVFLICILSLAVGFSVFYVAFPTQANDVINWTVELFEKEEQSTEQPPVQEQPSEQDPEPEQPTPDEPEEPTDPDPQMVSVDVYMCDTNVGVIEIEQAILDDASALESFWLENYDSTVRAQIDEDYAFSSIENLSNTQESAIRIKYLKQKMIDEGTLTMSSGSTRTYTISSNEKLISGVLFGQTAYLYNDNMVDEPISGETIVDFNKAYQYHSQIDDYASREGTVYVDFKTSIENNGETVMSMTVTFTGDVTLCKIWFDHFWVEFNGTVEL